MLSDSVRVLPEWTGLTASAIFAPEAAFFRCFKFSRILRPSLTLHVMPAVMPEIMQEAIRVARVVSLVPAVVWSPTAWWSSGRYVLGRWDCSGRERGVRFRFVSD